MKLHEITSTSLFAIKYVVSGKSTAALVGLSKQRELNFFPRHYF